LSSTRETKTNQREQGDASCRLDVWLFRTRLLKTRTLAARLISKGKVRLRRNGQMERIKKPHALIRPGDHVVFMRGQELISVEMLSAGIRRGPAPEAQRLYVRLEDANSSP
jgi:ribosome-associated heat shock protein Hsp15